ncbi:uncharacterized protein [Pyrus communis]|uniref:uncharacterized protein isoform X1 n=1 Tax=Pyrus communis TaxID=23211 RepID=UPI0035C22767
MGYASNVYAGNVLPTRDLTLQGTYSRMEVKGFGRIRYAYSFVRSKHLLKEMYIADELLKHDLDGKPSVDIPSCPVLVFVDIKDEKLGGRLYNEFCYRLNKKQGIGK